MVKIVFTSVTINMSKRRIRFVQERLQRNIWDNLKLTDNDGPLHCTALYYVTERIWQRKHLRQRFVFTVPTSLNRLKSWRG